MIRLMDILSYRRAHTSEGERRMVKKHLTAYAPVVFSDDAGEPLAYVVDIAQGNILPPILWCAHVDTVHASSGPIRQVVKYDPQIGLAWKEDGEPLGADDGAGVWLLLEMMDAGVPGTYIFHRGEERGGIGSNAIAKLYKDWLANYKFAIAFDRKGTTSVITKMSSGTCASTVFASALSALLGPAYAPDDTGSFTDTANYRGIIPECTNVSVGYENEHTGGEMLDVEHLFWLKGRMIDVFKGGIPPELFTVRVPTSANDNIYEFAGYGRYRNYGKYDTPIDFPMTAEAVMDMDFQALCDSIYDTDVEEIAKLIQDLAWAIVDDEVVDAT